MRRVRTVMVAGLIVCGLRLGLGAGDLATHWQAIGENGWGGHEAGVGCRVSEADSGGVRDGPGGQRVQAVGEWRGAEAEITWMSRMDRVEISSCSSWI